MSAALGCWKQAASFCCGPLEEVLLLHIELRVGWVFWFSVIRHCACDPTSAALCAKVKVMKTATDELWFFLQMIVLYLLRAVRTSSYLLFYMCHNAPWPCSHSGKSTFSLLTKTWRCKNHPCIIHWLGAPWGCLCSVFLWNRSLSARLVMLWVNYSAIYREHVMLFAGETCWFCSRFLLQICLMATLFCKFSLEEADGLSVLKIH